MTTNATREQESDASFLTSDEQTVFEVIAEDGIASDDKLRRHLDLELYEVRALTRQLERKDVIISKGRNRLLYNCTRYAVAPDVQEADR